MRALDGIVRDLPRPTAEVAAKASQRWWRASAGMGILATALSGIAWAFLAGLAMRYLIEPREDWVGLLVAVLCAAVVVAVVGRGHRRALR